jgi:hypothetical protein
LHLEAPRRARGVARLEENAANRALEAIDPAAYASARSERSDGSVTVDARLNALMPSRGKTHGMTFTSRPLTKASSRSVAQFEEAARVVASPPLAAAPIGNSTS